MAEEKFTSSQSVLFAFVVIYQMFADIPPSRPPSQCPAGVGEKKKKASFCVFPTQNQTTMAKCCQLSTQNGTHHFIVKYGTTILYLKGRLATLLTAKYH